MFMWVSICLCQCFQGQSWFRSVFVCVSVGLDQCLFGSVFVCVSVGLCQYLLESVYVWVSIC